MSLYICDHSSLVVLNAEYACGHCAHARPHEVIYYEDQAPCVDHPEHCVIAQVDTLCVPYAPDGRHFHE
jgi:hypothetical protein